MKKLNPNTFSLAVLAYIVVSFVVPALLHFVINAEHYAAVSFTRAEPIMSLGILTMIIQGAILAYLYPLF